MSSPKISVIMAEYNTNRNYIEQSIASILAQTFTDFEFIIVDDHGVNDVKRIADSFHDDRIRVIKNDINRGLVYSLNLAIQNSRGDYLARMDTDDIAMPHRLEKILNFIVSHPEYDVVGSRVMEFSEDGDTGVIGSEGVNNAKSLMRGAQLVHPSVIMRKAAILEVGGYPDFIRAEDLGLWCRLLINGSRLYILDDILLKYRVNSTDYSKRKLKYRTGELKARLYYYPKIGAGFFDYLRIIRMFASSIMPSRFVHLYRSNLKKKENRKHEHDEY